MKFSFMVITFITFVWASSTNAASYPEGYMQGHPSYNDNYYTPDYNRPQSPNYDPVIPPKKSSIHK